MERGATNVELRYHYSQKKKPMSIRAKNILFRADSSSKIGTGHIMRDLVLAEQFKDANIIFATQALPGNINHKIKEKGYAVELLDSNGVEALGALIKKYNISMVVIDHYGIDYAFEKQLKARTGVKLFVLDDTYERHDCDILLNHNISADAARYRGLVPEFCEVRCGVEYVLLREEFQQIKKRKRSLQGKTTYELLLALGGADHAQLNLQILETLLTAHRFKITVVTTRANPGLDSLRDFVASTPGVKLFVDSDDIASLMNNADCAIVSPSVIVNEVLSMGLPFIAIKTADNQREIFNFLSAKGFPVLSSFTRQELLTQLDDLCSNGYDQAVVCIQQLMKGFK